MSSTRRVFHLLPNAHLDPVWLWDWREGLTEGITTVSTILDLMDEFPELTFMRGEATIYRHIQQWAPEVFERIRAQIAAGRWDVVGGTMIQPDSNLSGTETLCRHFEAGLAYFERELGVRPRIAWQADSFGHPAGWPNILRAFGMEGFAFSRPQRSEFHMDSPAFWWNCDHGDRLLCYRQHYKWYCTERGNTEEMLAYTLEESAKSPYRNVGVLMGLGNHGGGPTRRHIDEVRAWAAQHPEIEVRFSTLHGLFDSLRAELQSAEAPEIPRVSGDLGYCLRGCYSSVQKFKAHFRQAEPQVAKAEASLAVIGAALDQPPSPALEEAWDWVLFNSFHDILPGSSIERAMEEQINWISSAVHQASKAQFTALNQLARAIDTQVPPASAPDQPRDVPLLVWNPLPYATSGHVELEASMDYRPRWEFQHRLHEMPFAVRDEAGELLPFQEIETEHFSMRDVPWRKRAVVRLDLPALGWRVIRMGLAESWPPVESSANACRATKGEAPSISNDRWKLEAVAGQGLSLSLDGAPLITPEAFQLLVVEDPWGSWGGMNEEPESYILDKVREQWALTQCEVIESGPERAALWTRWQGANSWVDFTFYIVRDTPWVEVRGRMLWNERSARLQLVLPGTGPARCDVPGSQVERTGRGQVPVARWFKRENGVGAQLGVASDVLSDADFLPTQTRLTLARASRYANDVHTTAEELPWLPATDCGELKFNLRLFAGGVDPDRVADSMLTTPVTLPVTPTPGGLPRTGSFGELSPAGVRVLSLQPQGNGLKIRVQNRNPGATRAAFTLGEVVHDLGEIGPQEIVTVIV